MTRTGAAAGRQTSAEQPTAEQPSAEQPSTVFIHDFASVDWPWPDGEIGFAASIHPALLRRLVIDAWRSEAREAASCGLSLGDPAQVDPAVHIGEPRHRNDAVVLPVAWFGTNAWLAPLEADLEIARFGPHRLHLHVLGRSQLPLTVRPCTTTASLHNRLAVAMVRHVLADLVAEIRRHAQAGPRL